MNNMDKNKENVGLFSLVRMFSQQRKSCRKTSVLNRRTKQASFEQPMAVVHREEKKPVGCTCLTKNCS